MVIIYMLVHMQVRYVYSVLHNNKVYLKQQYLLVIMVLYVYKYLVEICMLVQVMGKSKNWVVVILDGI